MPGPEHRQGRLPGARPSVQSQEGKAVVGTINFPPTSRGFCGQCPGGSALEKAVLLPPTFLAQPPGWPALPYPGASARVHVPLCAEGPRPSCPVHLSGLCGCPASPTARPRAGAWLLISGLNYVLKVDGSCAGWPIVGGGVPSGPAAIRGHFRVQACTGCLDLARRDRALPRSPVWTPKG